ncbi:MAG TPA: hypothetical protein PL151_12780 [Phycisphaerae bacterium]|nr:hypothetical protein [Phycisphaerae bacterium]HOJ73778.1 hypothetical protein [Phycisphaerae bacterium]HOM50425.1 hypothetical protein [Phycisphaerae bacterium]HON65471.1 hypothetical protein [Phycisphaerae bacterium]HOQ84163.1 hypothetical protein [Phycisphaerae bacterium]
MHTRIAMAIALAVCLVLSPIGLAAEKEKSTAAKQPAAKQPVKKVEAKKDSKPPAATSWKTGAAPIVRTIPYQPPASTQPARATTRPAGTYIFQTPPKYDYFADHYGRSTSTSLLGYVAPENSKTSPATGANAGNPFIYRRGQ